MPDPLIRLAQPADAPAIRDLIQSAYRGDSSRTGWTTEADLLEGERISVAGVEEKITAERGAVLLLEQEGHTGPVACCEVQDLGDGLAYFGLFAVSPGLQSAGLGRRLMDAAEEYVQATWGATELEMQVVNGRPELVGWYQRRGFVLTGETRPFPVLEASSRVIGDELWFEVLLKKLGSD